MKDEAPEGRRGEPGPRCSIAKALFLNNPISWELVLFCYPLIFLVRASADFKRDNLEIPQKSSSDLGTLEALDFSLKEIFGVQG